MGCRGDELAAVIKHLQAVSISYSQFHTLTRVGVSQKQGPEATQKVDSSRFQAHGWVVGGWEDPRDRPTWRASL